MQQSKQSIYSIWIVFLVGTFFHELAHFIVSLLTFGFPYKFSIIPHKDEESGGYVVGHVKSFNHAWYNVFLISMAPLLLLPFSFFIYKSFFDWFDTTIINFFIWIFIIVSLVFSSLPSSIDFKNAFSGNIISNIFGALVFSAIYYYLFYIGAFEWLYFKILQMIQS